MCCRVAGLGDNAPRASAEGTEGAEGDRLVVHIDVLAREDGGVIADLAGAIHVGGETGVRAATT